MVRTSFIFRKYNSIHFFEWIINIIFIFKDSFENLVECRKEIDKFIDGLKTKFAKILNVNENELNKKKEKTKYMKCYDELIKNLHTCLPINKNTYLSRYSYLFSNTCNTLKKLDNSNTLTKIPDLKKIISEECSKLSHITKKTKIVWIIFYLI